MIIFFIEALFCFLFTVLLYFKYAMKNTRLYVTLLVISVWFLTFLTAIIVPFDIYLTTRNSLDPQEHNEEIFVFKVIYLVIYWTIYVLSWIVIPIAQEYEKAGDFTSGERMKRAIKRNVVAYVIFMVIGLIFLTYLVVKRQLTGQNLIAFLMALSNAWGIFLIIFLLGYGLVAVPKHTLKLSDYETRLRYLEWQAGECYDHLMASNDDLITCANKIKSVRSILDSESHNPNRGFLEKIWLDINNLNFYLPSTQNSIVEEEILTYSNKFSYEDLIELNMNIKKNKYNIMRLKCEQEEIFKEWRYLKEQLDRKGPNDEKKGFMAGLSRQYHKRLRPFVIICVGMFFIMLSLATILSEVTLFTNLPLSIFGLLIEQTENILLLNLLCLIPLLYLLYTSLYGLFKLKLAGFYSMHDNQHTDSISLLFLTGFMCRIGFPLCLNFVQVLKLSSASTILEQTMGVTDLVPVLGRNFIIFYPTILVVLCVFNLFDLFGKLMNALGFYSFGFQNAYNEEKIEDGRDVLMKMQITYERERNEEIQRKKSDLSSNLIVARKDIEDIETKLTIRKKY